MPRPARPGTAGAGEALEDAGQGVQWQVLGRKGHEIQGEERPGAHGPDVGEGVGRGDLPEGEGVVDHRGEEVDGGDHRLGGRQTVHRGVVVRGEPHQRPCVLSGLQAAQDLRQIRRSELGGSTGAVAELGQPPRPRHVVHGTFS